jgi:hypothetical protein
MKRFAFAHRWIHFKEAAFNQYYASALDLHGNAHLDGFWQYPDYFADQDELGFASPRQRSADRMLNKLIS